MMDLPELIILDIGHGNCAIVRDTEGVIVIDSAHGATLIETLAHLSIREISHILISHADEDHIAGIIDILLDRNIKVTNIYINSDAQRKTRTWEALRRAVRDARQRSGTRVVVGLTTELTNQLNVGQVKVEILAPTPELAMSGAGGQDLQGRRLNPNSTSAVIGLVHDSHRVAILAGDIDQVGLNNLLEERSDLKADILVFPHHGGRPGGADSQAFAQQLCDLVQPNLVVFSIGRGRFGNPRQDIVEGVVTSLPTAHILCTQLSSNCADSVPDSEPAHLNALPARGRTSNSCCGGTVSIKIAGNTTTYAAGIAGHQQFIDRVSNPLCRRFKV
ncbi:ComEC/Rec2 family competence protein [Microcoleus sp. B4-D4]|uniref:ComEC/Rec2 family competence protein n=1 Tax=Microcoleus sp. B4-D4 TaxID=2818667 RepID=UPI002FD5B472